MAQLMHPRIGVLMGIDSDVHVLTMAGSEVVGDLVSKLRDLGSQHISK